jgi:hypothetical protein
LGEFGSADSICSKKARTSSDGWPALNDASLRESRRAIALGIEGKSDENISIKKVRQLINLDSK